MKESITDRVLRLSNFVVLLFSLIIAGVSLSLSLTVFGHILAVTQLLVLFSFVPRRALFRLPKVIGVFSLVIFLAAIYFQVVRNGQPKNGLIFSSNFPKTFSIVNSILAEEDGMLLAAKILPFIGGVTKRESMGFARSLETQYQRMRREEGFFQTPLISTVLGLQTSSRFDMLSFHAADLSKKKAIIFLHGTLGNWSLLCWLFSEPAREVGYDVFCPSGGLLGDWDSTRGRKIMTSTIEHLKSLGYEGISLAGLSAGAIGASALANQYESDIRQLILLFGNNPRVEFIKSPTLIVYGANDERFPASWMKTLAEAQMKNSPSLLIHEIQGDHFALVKHKGAVQEEVRTWLKQQSENSAP